MEIIKIIGVGLLTVICILIVKPLKPEIAVCIGLVGGIIILSMLANYCAEIIKTFSFIIEKTGLNANIYKTILKIIGVGYLTEFAASLCSDSGNMSIADKILLGGKIIILVYSLPIITSIIEILMGILP